MNRINLDTFDHEKMFKVKMEVYLYKDAAIILKQGKGNSADLKKYMEKRLRIIEKLLEVVRPFSIFEGEEGLLEVRK